MTYMNRALLLLLAVSAATTKNENSCSVTAFAPAALPQHSNQRTNLKQFSRTALDSISNSW